MVRHFSHFIAIDWSGAKGERHKGIAVAIADAGGGPPVLVKREAGWSRAEILAILRDELPQESLIGLDLGLSLPFEDCGAYFPGWDASPADAKSLWAMIDSICAGDEHLAASNFVDHKIASSYFRRHGGRQGAHFGSGRGRLRITEQRQQLQGCNPYSNFNLIGAAQVGKSSLTGMRVLHALAGKLPVWPVNPFPKNGSLVIEIYTALAAIAAGRSASSSKIRDHAQLDQALANLGSPTIGETGPIDDHSSDALLTAAWLRANAQRPELWAPKSLTRKIAQTEGWTFGVA